MGFFLVAGRLCLLLTKKPSPWIAALADPCPKYAQLVNLHVIYACVCVHNHSASEYGRSTSDSL